MIAPGAALAWMPDKTLWSNAMNIDRGAQIWIQMCLGPSGTRGSHKVDGLLWTPLCVRGIFCMDGEQFCDKIEYET